MSEAHYTRAVFSAADPAPEVVRRMGPVIGVELRTLLDVSPPPVPILAAIIADLVEVLAAAAAAGDIHGQLEAHHLFVDERGAAAIEGFGVAPSRGTPRADLERLVALVRGWVPPEGAHLAAALTVSDFGVLAPRLRRLAHDLGPADVGSWGAGALDGFAHHRLAPTEDAMGPFLARPAPIAARNPPLTLAPVVTLLVGVVLAGSVLAGLGVTAFMSWRVQRPPTAIHQPLPLVPGP